MFLKKTTLAAMLLLAGTLAAAAAPATVTANANVRAGAGTNFRVVATLASGSRVEIGNCRNGWCELQQRGPKAFISQSLLRIGAAAPRRPMAQPHQSKPFLHVQPPKAQPPRPNHSQVQRPKPQHVQPPHAQPSRPGPGNPPHGQPPRR